MIGSEEVVVWAMYNRYRNAAHRRESKNDVRRVAFVIGGIFDNRKLMVAILSQRMYPFSLQKDTQDKELEECVPLGSGRLVSRGGISAPD